VVGGAARAARASRCWFAARVITIRDIPSFSLAAVGEGSLQEKDLERTDSEPQPEIVVPCRSHVGVVT